KEATGLSSSHIMAEAFLPSAESEISQSILIAQSGSLTPPPLARPASSQASPVESLAAAASTPTGDTLRENRLVTLLREMSELHHRMATLLQQSCEALLHLTIQLHPERQEEWQVSLNALRQISSILEGLQADLSRLSSETPREIRRPPPRSRPASSSSPSSEFAASGDPPDDPPPPTLEDAVLSTRLHVRVEPHHQARHPRNAP
ncbi:MAG: hypothetical protein NZU63_14805, partial [Gemmataceae bacterium]|nr:hypothetical protein [Gemmataceae bacterium]